MFEVSIRPAVVLACVLATAPAASGCSKGAQKQRHIDRGDQYFAEGKFKEAVIEYRNVLQIDAGSKEVNRKLGLAAYEAGQMSGASTFLERAYEQDPSDVEVRLKLGALQLLSRQPEKAREHARFVLSKKPDEFRAVGLLADTAQTDEEIAEAIQILEDRPDRFGQKESVERALGLLYARKKDTPRAEKALMAAISAKPDSPDAHYTLARLLVSKGELEQAEKEFRAAAALAPPGSRYQLELADFLVTTGKTAAGRAVLEEITQKVPDAYPAWIRLSDVAFKEGRLDEAGKAADVVLRAQPDNTSALLVQAQVELARGETKKGVDIAARAVKLDPRLPQAHYMLARALVQSGNVSMARSAANDAVARAPQYPEAVFLAADLALRTGDPQGAASVLQPYIEKVPNDPRPYLQLGIAQLRANDFAKANESLRVFMRLAPKDARGPYTAGLAARMEEKPADARKRFEEALALAPEYPEPLMQLVDMSFRDKQPSAAVERAKKQAGLAPKSAEVGFVLARAYEVAGKTAEAEKELLRVIELNPNLMNTYTQLSAIYARARDYPRAFAMIDKALAKDPDNASMLMLAGSLHQIQGDAAKAREAYEKILVKQPKFAGAANNLAWMLAEEGQDLKRAQALAQTARDAAPDDPNVADTLGWVLYKQGAYPGALALFKESLEKRPNNAEVLVHQGLTHHKLGDTQLAKAVLRRALELNPNVAGAAEAKALLEGK